MNNNLNLINSLNSSTDRVVLLPKNPDMFFVFWQFSDARTKLFMSGSYKNEIILKLFNAQDRTCLPAVEQDTTHRQAGIAEFKFKWDTFKAYIPCLKNMPGVYAVAFAETMSGSVETLAESNIFAICPASSGSQNFLTDNSEYYRKAVV